MTMEQFWESDPAELSVYADAFNLQIERRDRDAWYLGMYIHDAVASCLNKKNKFPSKPYKDGFYAESKLTQEERDEREIRRQIAQMREDAERAKEMGLKRNFEEEGDGNEQQHQDQ